MDSNKLASSEQEVALEHSPKFLALDALLLSIVEAFEQYKEHRVS